MSSGRGAQPALVEVAADVQRVQLINALRLFDRCARALADAKRRGVAASDGGNALRLRAVASSLVREIKELVLQVVAHVEACAAAIVGPRLAAESGPISQQTLKAAKRTQKRRLQRVMRAGRRPQPPCSRLACHLWRCSRRRRGWPGLRLQSSGDSSLPPLCGKSGAWHASRRLLGGSALTWLWPSSSLCLSARLRQISVRAESGNPSGRGADVRAGWAQGAKGPLDSCGEPPPITATAP